MFKSPSDKINYRGQIGWNPTNRHYDALSARYPEAEAKMVALESLLQRGKEQDSSGPIPNNVESRTNNGHKREQEGAALEPDPTASTTNESEVDQRMGP
jgi:hypothetical protein